MKHTRQIFMVQVAAIVAAVTALLTVGGLLGLVFAEFDMVLVYLLLGSLPLLSIAVWYLRYKKITGKEFFDCLWIFTLPWVP